MSPGALSLGISYAILNVNYRVQQARQINDFNLPCKALGGFFIGWKVWGLVIRGLPFSDGKLAYILRWYNLCGLLCSIGRNKKSMPC